MLFALDWMKKTWDAMVSAICTLTEGLDLFTVSAAISSLWPVLAACLTAGLLLCFLGFRYHKFVHGITGGILLGALGWHIGQVINAGQLSIAAVYAVMLAIVGFFTWYLCYFLNVFIGGCFLFLAVLAPFRAGLQEYALLIAILLSVIYCAFYIKYKMAMTAVTGAIVLGMAMLNSSPAVSAIIVCGCIASGIYVQLVLRRRYEKQKIISMQEQLEKYPYGPGLVYGWEDPTISQPEKERS